LSLQWTGATRITMARIIYSDTFEPRTQNESDWLYNGLDCCVTLEVLQAIKPMLDNVSSSTYEFEKDMQGPIMEMTLNGLLVDQRKRDKVLANCYRDMEKVEGQLEQIVNLGIGIPWRTPRVGTKSWRSPWTSKTCSSTFLVSRQSRRGEQMADTLYQLTVKLLKSCQQTSEPNPSAPESSCYMTLTRKDNVWRLA
jgi:hypothetical protein